MKPSRDNALSPEGVKVLTEEEIRNRLYGEYLRFSKKEKLVPTEFSSPASSNDPPWTGREILSAELKELRSELISLRKEQEDLNRQLQHYKVLDPEVRVSSPGSSGNLWGFLVGATVFAVGFMGPLSFKLLQASPQVVGGEATPYTVQVAVYDVKPIAQEASTQLTQMGYPVFLTESSRKSGRLQYRLYMGSFVTKEEAERERLRLRTDPRFAAFSDAFVRLR